MTKARKTINRKKRNENIMGWTFISPLLAGLLAFLFFPLLFAIIVSFTDYKINSSELINGVQVPIEFFDFKFNFTLSNYKAVFKNTLFWQSMYNAVINALGVPIGIILAVVFTNLLIKNQKGSLFFRTLYYLPTVCGAVVITFIWKWIFTMLQQEIFRQTGDPNVNLLTGSSFRSSMIIMGVWSGIGTSVLMLYSAMKGVDKSLYESAQIDGANGFDQLVHITIPAISPVAFYVLLTGIAGSFQDFARFEVMAGTPAPYSSMPVWEIYRVVTEANDISLASAMGIILGLILICLSAVQFIVSRLWVHYE